MLFAKIQNVVLCILFDFLLQNMCILCDFCKIKNQTWVTLVCNFAKILHCGCYSWKTIF